MFATDRHLLILEPNLVRDAAWIGQRLVKGAGDIAGTTLTMTTQDIGFDLVGVEPGQVVVAGGVAYEIIQVEGADQLTISRMRPTDDGPILPPSPATGVTVELPTFRPQLAMIHAQVLRMLGIDPDEVPMPGVVTEAGITNGDSLAFFEALGALHLIFTAAAALSGPDSPAAYKAALYRDRFAAERSRVAARIDTNGDGLPDATRRPSLIPTIRA